MSARVNTTESRTWTNERKKLELTCIQGPEETEVSANGPAVQYNGLKVALRWRAYLGAQDHSLQWGDLQTASTEQPYKKWVAVSPRLRKYWVLKPNLFSNVQISNPFKKEKLFFPCKPGSTSANNPGPKSPGQKLKMKTYDWKKDTLSGSCSRKHTAADHYSFWYSFWEHRV